MLRITVEMIPRGDESKAHVLTTATIANDGTGDLATGSYDVTLMKQFPYRPGVWRRGKVRGFPRKSMGVWDLIYRALQVTVGGRNGG